MDAKIKIRAVDLFPGQFGIANLELPGNVIIKALQAALAARIATGKITFEQVEKKLVGRKAWHTTNRPAWAMNGRKA